MWLKTPYSWFKLLQIFSFRRLHLFTPYHPKQLLDEKKARTKAKRKKKQADFLKGPEVKALLEYCEEPRMRGEILAFMNTVMTISASYFRKSGEAREEIVAGTSKKA